MKKQILITACSMDIGGIERSLVGLLNTFNYDIYDVDLLLFSKKGDLLSQIPSRCNILPENPKLASFQKPIKEAALSGCILPAAARLFSKFIINILPTGKKIRNKKDSGASLLQAYWDYSIQLMPKLDKKYDAVLSFMWPHHFAAKKVKADYKIAWIHTDYNELKLNNKKDAAVWKHFDKIAAVSDECGSAFLSVYPFFNDNLITVENILPGEFVRRESEKFIPEDMPVGNEFVILSVGRFCYAKAFDFAVDICKKLIDDKFNVKWYIIGFGSEEMIIRNKIKELDLMENFIILGKKNNPYPYIKACDIYVQPSRYEGKAVTVREAQMLGKPVIISNFRTSASQVKAGYDAIISPMNSNDMAGNIITLLNDVSLRKKLIENSLASDYSNIGQIEKIYSLLDYKGN